MPSSLKIAVILSGAKNPDEARTTTTARTLQPQRSTALKRGVYLAGFAVSSRYALLSVPFAFATVMSVG
jgi:hypothetical protein